MGEARPRLTLNKGLHIECERICTVRVASLSNRNPSPKTNLVFGCHGDNGAGIAVCTAEEVLTSTPAAPADIRENKALH